MEIKGKVWCLFEQSCTFKNEFKALGYEAVDVDIQNNYNETDKLVDLFEAIENAYDGKPSLFDEITEDDLCIAFFPCIYFSALSQMAFSFGYTNYRKMSMKDKTDKILERSHNREYYFSLAVKMISVAHQRGIRLIMENPWNEQTFLKANFVMPPTIVDHDRTRRGDHFVKPTAFFYVNCEPTKGFTYMKNNDRKIILKSKMSKLAGLCSEERSMISPVYARNFICDWVIGKEQGCSQLNLFK